MPKKNRHSKKNKNKKINLTDNPNLPKNHPIEEEKKSATRTIPMPGMEMEEHPNTSPSPGTFAWIRSAFSSAALSSNPALSSPLNLNLNNSSSSITSPEEITEELPISEPTSHKFGLLTVGSAISKTVISLLSSAPSAINAMTAPTNKQPSDISLDWWNSMSTRLKVLSVWNALASLSVNVVFAYKSFPDAAAKLKKSILKSPKNIREGLKNASLLLLSISAAIASSSIAYSAFAEISPVIATIFTMGTLIIYFTSRFSGIKNFTNRISSSYDSDMNVLDEAIDILKRTRKEDVGIYNAILLEAFEDNGRKLNDDATIAAFAQMFAEEINHNHNALVEKKTHHAHRAETAAFMLKLTFALIIGVTAFPTFTQKGFDGVNKFTSRVFDKNLNDIHVFYKGLIGTLPGTATAALYAISAFDLPKLTLDILLDFWARPKVLPILMFLYFVVANYFASSSMEIVAEGTLEEPNHIFSFLSPDNILGKLFILANQIGGGVTNTKSNFSVFVQPNQQNPEFHDLLKVLRHHRDIDHKLSDEATKAFRRATFFAKSTPYSDKVTLKRGISSQRSIPDLHGLEEGHRSLRLTD